MLKKLFYEALVVAIALTLWHSPVECIEVVNGNVITAQKLGSYVKNNEVKIIDVRGVWDYSIGHIPGAVRISNKEFEDPDNPVEGMIAPARIIESLMSANGINADDRVVIYADYKKPQMATRLWWVLKVYGHKNVQVLDGQYRAWIDAGYPVERWRCTKPEPSVYKTGNLDKNRIAVFRDCKVLSGDAVLLDVRTHDEYTGKRTSEKAGRGGHIPGAVNVYYMNTVDERGFFKDVQSLRTIYSAAGVTPDREVIIYCMRAHRASHTYFVLVNLLGFSRVRIYDGSWIEWSNLPGYPVTTGESR